MYAVDFLDIVVKLIPFHLRKTTIIAYLTAILKPFQTLNALFVQFTEDTNYRLIFTGQVIYLEHYLNDLYDPTLRRIYIEDVANIQFDYIFQDIEQRPPVYVYQQAEGQPPFYIAQQSEYDQAINFIIHIPVSITFDELIVRKQVDVYKQAGRQYSIETF